jgi:hypothetical protein
LPELQALRGLLRVAAGDRAGGLADAAESGKKFGDDPRVAVWNVTARIHAGDFLGAHLDADRLAAVVPGDPLPDLLHRQIKLYRRLGPEKVQAHLRLARETPWPIKVSFQRAGVLLTREPDRALQLLEKALTLAQESKDPAVKELELEARCRFGLALAYALLAEKGVTTNKLKRELHPAPRELDHDKPSKNVEEQVKPDLTDLQERLKKQKAVVEQARIARVHADAEFQIIQAQNKADVAAAETFLELARIDLDKHVKGDTAQAFLALEERIEKARADVDSWQDRAAWSARMVKKNLMTRAQADADAARLEASQLVLNKVLEERRAFAKKNGLVVQQFADKVSEARANLARVKKGAALREAPAGVVRDAAQALWEDARQRHEALEAEIDRAKAPPPPVKEQKQAPPAKGEFQQPTNPGMAHAEALIRDHPERPSGYLALALLRMVTDAPAAEVAAAFSEAARRAGNPDPLLDDLVASLGTDRGVAAVGVRLWLSMVGRGQDGTAVMNQLIELLGPSPDAEFLKAMRDQKDIDFAEAIRSLRGSGLGRGGLLHGGAEEREAVRLGLRKAAARLPDRPVSDPVSLTLLSVFFAVHISAEFEGKDADHISRACLHYLRLSSAPDLPDELPDEVAELRAAAVLLMGTMRFQKGMMGALKEGGFDEKKFKAMSDRLEQAVRDGDAAATRRELAAMNAALRQVFAVAKKATRAEVAQVRKEGGPLAGAALELILAAAQKEFAGQKVGRPPLPKGAEALLEGSAELRDLDRIMAELPRELFAARDQRVVWKDVLANTRNRTDAATMLSVVTLLSKMFHDLKMMVDQKELQEMKAEMRLRLNLGGSPGEAALLGMQGQPPVERPPVPPPEEAGESQGLGWWPAAGAAVVGVVAAAVVAWLLLARRRRPNRPTLA